MGPVHFVEGYYGKPVPTNLGLASFLTVFNAMVKNSDKKIINATEGGAKIQGTEQIPLKTVIEKYCREDIDKSKVKDLLSYAEDGEELIEKVIPLLEQDIENLDNIIVHSRKGLATCHGAKKIIDRAQYENLLSKKSTKVLNKASKESKEEADKKYGKENYVKRYEIYYEKLKKRIKKSWLRNWILLSEKNFSARSRSSDNPPVASEILPRVT